MKAFLKKNLRVVIGVSVFVFMLIIDVVSKDLVNKYVELNSETIHAIPHLFNIVHVHNYGAAFGMGSGNEALKIVFIVVSLLAVAVLGAGLILFGKKSKLLSIGLGFIIAGALGNAIDRIALGYVDDFIQFAFWEKFATFNIADVGVICGLIMVLVYIIFFFKDSKKESIKKSDKEELKENDGEKA